MGRSTWARRVSWTHPYGPGPTGLTRHRRRDARPCSVPFSRALLARRAPARVVLVIGVTFGRRDVLVAVEQVGRVVATLDRRQPLPGRPRVGLADARRALVAQEVDVRAGVTVSQRRGEPVDPGLVDLRLLATLVDRGHVHHQPTRSVGERGG